MDMMTEKIIKNLDIKNLTIVNSRNKLDINKLKQLVVLDNILSKERNPDAYIKKLADRMHKDNYLVIVDRVLDIDDAYMNVLEFINNKKHIRFYTVAEVIDFTKDSFRLSNFDTVFSASSIETANQKLLEEFDNLPMHIKELIDYKYNNSIININNRYGVYTFVRF